MDDEDLDFEYQLIIPPEHKPKTKVSKPEENQTCHTKEAEQCSTIPARTSQQQASSETSWAAFGVSFNASSHETQETIPDL